MTPTRRTYLKGAGSIVAASGLAIPATAAEPEWRTVETPIDEELHGVVDAADVPYAVGGNGVAVRAGADGWELVFDGGPTGNGNDLYGAGTTDDDERVWVVGASGAIGEYDTTTGSLADYSAPNDVTNNFNDVAVTGEAGDANVYVAGDSGKIYYSFENGETGSWNELTPGSGAAVHDIDFYEDRAGNAIDGDQTVFSTDDGGTYDPIGVEDADHAFSGLTAAAPDAVTVVGGGGTVLEYDGAGWTRTDLGDAQLNSVSGRDLVAGEGGAVFRRTDGWAQEATPTGANLSDIVAGDTDVAVGAGGVVLET